MKGNESRDMKEGRLAERKEKEVRKEGRKDSQADGRSEGETNNEGGRMSTRGMTKKREARTREGEKAIRNEERV